MKHKKQDPIQALFKELEREDKKFGGRKIKKADTDTHKKRQVTNYKKAWESHEEDWYEVDEFFGE